MAGGLNEEEAAVNSGILNISFALSGEFFSKICGMLILDILDNWIPASIVIDLVAISRGINNVQPQTNSILLNNMRDGLNLSSGADWLIGS